MAPTSLRPKISVLPMARKHCTGCPVPSLSSSVPFPLFPCSLCFSYSLLHVSQTHQAWSCLRTFALAVLLAWTIFPLISPRLLPHFLHIFIQMTPSHEGLLRTPKITSFLGDSVVKNPPAKVGDRGFNPWIGKIPWRRKWQATLSSILAWKIPWTEEPGGL